MARRRHSRFIRPAPKTKMWIGAGVGVDTITASTLHLISSLSAATLLLRPFTVLRTRMDLAYISDQEAADETPFGVFASIVVTDAASAIGVTAIPSPSANPEADWFVFQAVHAHAVNLTGGDVALNEYNWTIDSKAMRKVGPDDDLLGMFSQQAAVGAFLVTNGRRLIQLH